MGRDASIIIEQVKFTYNGTYTCQVKNPPDVHGAIGETRLRVVTTGLQFSPETKFIFLTKLTFLCATKGKMLLRTITLGLYFSVISRYFLNYTLNYASVEGRYCTS